MSGIGDLYGPPQGSKKSKNAPATPPPAVGSLNSPTLDIGTIKKGAAKGLSVLGDMLARPSEGVEALLARGGGAALHALLRGEKPGQQSADRLAILQRESALSGLPLAQAYQGAPGWARNIGAAATDTALDPTTYLGGAGLIEKGVKAVAPHLASLLARGASKAALPRAAYDTLTANGEAVRGLYNALPAAKAQRVISKLETLKRADQNAQRLSGTMLAGTERRTAAEKLADRTLGVQPVQATKPLIPAADLSRIRGVIAKGADPEIVYKNMKRAGLMPYATKKAFLAALKPASKKAAAVQYSDKDLLGGLRLSASEKDAIRPAVRRYMVGPQKLPRSELAKALVGGDSTIQRLVELTNLPYFMLPFRHMANIGALTGLRDPMGLLETLGRKIGQNFSPSLKAANNKMIENFQQRGLQGFSDYRGMPGGLQGLPALAAKLKPLAPVAHAIQGASNKVYDWSQHTLWNWDDLARATLIKRGIARGIAPEEAAHQTNRALVDYGVTSPFTQSLYDVAPFATFRTGIPGAVLRSTLQHPERAQIADRLTGGTFTGGTGDQGIERMYLPPADVGRGVLGDPLGYLRGTLSWPVQDILSLSGDASAAALHGEPAKAKDAKEFGHYFTYGKPVVYYDKKAKKWKSLLPTQLIRVPFSDEMFQSLSPFKNNGAKSDLLQSQFGVKPSGG